MVNEADGTAISVVKIEGRRIDGNASPADGHQRILIADLTVVSAGWLAEITARQVGGIAGPNLGKANVWIPGSARSLSLPPPCEQPRVEYLHQPVHGINCRSDEDQDDFDIFGVATA